MVRNDLICIQCHLILTQRVTSLELYFCKEYDSKDGYTYTDYFHIDSFRQNLTNNNDLIKLNLFVLGGKDAIILLTSDDQKKNVPVYEIGLSTVHLTLFIDCRNMSRPRISISLCLSKTLFLSK